MSKRGATVTRKIVFFNRQKPPAEPDSVVVDPLPPPVGLREREKGREWKRGREGDRERETEGERKRKRDRGRVGLWRSSGRDSGSIINTCRKRYEKVKDGKWLDFGQCSLSVYLWVQLEGFIALLWWEDVTSLCLPTGLQWFWTWVLYVSVSVIWQTWQGRREKEQVQLGGSQNCTLQVKTWDMTDRFKQDIIINAIEITDIISNNQSLIHFNKLQSVCVSIKQSEFNYYIRVQRCLLRVQWSN